ncbi:hypothetical protein BDV96DRAFT_563688 [Lophiotrema nucula]|uniref:ATPase synthesis protein 25 n=1 Tax=Lophiotrema nucula TaxID=690887 RepID=A0A6A5ZNA4_9PLEO|nr:hypothetical protein BDV96DRAFT_563688 [Lophiotrema nucula]
MALTRVVPPNSVCTSCQQAIRRGFNTQWPVNKPLVASRTFASTARRKEEGDVGFQSLDPLPGSPSTPTRSSSNTQDPPPASYSESSNPLDTPETEEQTTPTPPATSIPWYLQAQRDRPVVAPSTESQQRALIPDLPPNPPPLLKTLMDHISTNLGLDDLLLFDLRTLDPPPALGSKLIMLTGTARSEKHLHVSADRFCRWLRREHGLRANAAGLLGRNELKIKLRRKAKRMKMLANVGAADPAGGNIDDGIRTGWICCTVGKLEAHPEDTHIPGADVENFVGFREVSTGVNFVVQMFTEEKREEIDLETLWGGIVKSTERQNRQADEKLAELEREIEELEAREEEGEEGGAEMMKPASEPTEPAKPFIYRSPGDTPVVPVRQFTIPTPTKGDAFPPSSNLRNRQLRRLHTLGL